MANVYSALDASVNVKGRYITDLAEDTFVGWEKDEENMSVKMGANGKSAVSRINDTRGTITITVMQNSGDATYLNKLANTGDIFPITVISGNEKVSATEAFVKKTADGELGREITEREFEIQCLDMRVE